jgi:hypothetical protein
VVREQDFPVVSHPLAEAVVTIAIKQGQVPVFSNFGGKREFHPVETEDCENH